MLHYCYGWFSVARALKARSIVWCFHKPGVGLLCMYPCLPVVFSGVPVPITPPVVSHTYPFVFLQSFVALSSNAYCCVTSFGMSSNFSQRYSYLFIGVLRWKFLISIMTLLRSNFKVSKSAVCTPQSLG